MSATVFVSTVTCAACGWTLRDNVAENDGMSLLGARCGYKGCDGVLTDTVAIVGETVARELRYRLGWETPPCADECRAFLLAEYAKFDIEATVTPVMPLVPSGYEPIDMRCPHGVLWFAEPTSEQQAQWAADGVE